MSNAHCTKLLWLMIKRVIGWLVAGTIMCNIFKYPIGNSWRQPWGQPISGLVLVWCRVSGVQISRWLICIRLVLKDSVQKHCGQESVVPTISAKTKANNWCLGVISCVWFVAIKHSQMALMHAFLGSTFIGNKQISYVTITRPWRCTKY